MVKLVKFSPMKLLLVRPLWYVEAAGVTPPLGAMYLASAARQWVSPPPEVKLIHMRASMHSVAQYKRLLQSYNPDVVGFSVLTVEAPGLYNIMSLTKSILPSAFIVVGGPHATFFTDHVLNKPEPDAVVVGEGEETFVELLDRLQSGKDWTDIRGLAYSSNGEHVINPPRPFITDMDSIPHPAWDLIDIKAYDKTVSMNSFLAKSPYMPIMTSRGCPYKCVYCHKIFGKRFRARSVENVVDEIRALNRDYGVKEIHFFDDIFNYDLDTAKEICREIIRSGIDIKLAFPNGVRGDRLDDELIRLLAQAGTYCMVFAVETVTPRLQKMMKKNLDVEKVRENMEKAYNAGIIPSAFFMLGFPSETPEEMEETIKFAIKSKALRALFFSVLAYPRTELFDIVKQNYPDYEFNEENLPSLHYRKPVYQTAANGFVDLKKVIRSAYRRFYFRPWRVYNIIRMYPKNKQFFRAIFRSSTHFFKIGAAFETFLLSLKNWKSGVIKVSNKQLKIMPYQEHKTTGTLKSRLKLNNQRNHK